MSGVNNNGLQSASGIAALFIATGQDGANVAESSAALGFSELLPNGDWYGSITLASLIVGTYGGGTGLPTQRECGELSLAWAIVVEDWVRAHDLFGRNRP
jgi:hydroxymethylglutaryl-CoA reductase (NADPH)